MYGKVFASVFIIFKTLSTHGKPIKYAKYADLPISRDIPRSLLYYSALS